MAAHGERRPHGAGRAVGREFGLDRSRFDRRPLAGADRDRAVDSPAAVCGGVAPARGIGERAPQQRLGVGMHDRPLRSARNADEDAVVGASSGFDAVGGVHAERKRAAFVAAAKPPVHEDVGPVVAGGKADAHAPARVRDRQVERAGDPPELGDVSEPGAHLAGDVDGLPGREVITAAEKILGIGARRAGLPFAVQYDRRRGTARARAGRNERRRGRERRRVQHRLVHVGRRGKRIGFRDHPLVEVVAGRALEDQQPRRVLGASAGLDQSAGIDLGRGAGCVRADPIRAGRSMHDERAVLRDERGGDQIVAPARAHSCRGPARGAERKQLDARER